MGRIRRASEWRSIKVSRPNLTLASTEKVVKRRNSGNYLSPWQMDRWSVNPQSFSIISSPSMAGKHGMHREPGTAEMIISAHVGGLSIFKLGAIFFSMFSIFLVGILISILLG